MSDVLMSFMSLVSPGDDVDPRLKRSQLARVARCTSLSERWVFRQIPRADDACDVAAATKADALMARTLLMMSCVARLDDEDIGTGGNVDKAWRRAGGQCPSTDAKYQPSVSVPIPTEASLPRAGGALPPRRRLSRALLLPANPPWRLLSPSPSTCDPTPRLPGEQRSATGWGAAAGELLLDVGGAPSASGDGPAASLRPSPLLPRHGAIIQIVPWDGVCNRQAINSLRAMRRGDRYLFYHSGAGAASRHIVSVVEVAREWHEGEGEAASCGVVDVRVVGEFRRLVALGGSR
ncbi:hypothetical protein OsJ_18571 [Oryza sativa Japonica Group]|uniref:EVE domain-containing protein n=1 Tax=Oryza sativa subsp. japonica TaxID=39947 RepID=B9FPN1_ORYSJ|nr:hypothetical protein OsJ_18571 [Oryza sativa Japonica Group]